MYAQIEKEAAVLAAELCEAAKLKGGQIVVVGCSTSEVCGERIGSASVPEAADALLRGLKSVFDEKGIFIAAQCCEHLNRAIVIEREALPSAYCVNVVPRPKAGGSFATAAYREARDPIVVENILADAGLDIGLTLIGMHLKPVAVPLRLQTKTVGEALVCAARTRAKFIGGERACYNEDLM